MPESGNVLKACNRRLPNFERETEEEWRGPFFFVQAADTQLGMISCRRKGPDDDWTEEMRLIKKAITAVNLMKPKPRFFVICGDLVNEQPERHRQYREEQIADFKKAFSELSPDIPLICVCGNHDVGDHPTPATVKMYTDDFGDDYFAFWCGGIKFIVLNSQFYEDSSLVPELATAQNHWLEEELSDAGNYKHTIIFQHIPWFVHSLEEEKTTFNILPEVRMKMLQKFWKAGVRTIFCGHYHRNGGGFYKNMEVVVTSAIGCQFGSDLSGLRIVAVTDTDINHHYYDLDSIPKKITL